MPFDTTKERTYWRRYFRQRGFNICAHCGVGVIWDAKIANPHGKAGTISDRAANVDHIISSKAECRRLGIVYTSLPNLQVLCRKCNYEKNNREAPSSTKFTGTLRIQ